LVVVIGFLGLLVGTMILGTDTFARIGWSCPRARC
jgi:hypothetical protein